MVIPVLLAGGEGKRLWPLSNGRTPKQFLSVITNNISFYQATLERVIQCVNAKKIITVTSHSFVNSVKKQFEPFESICRNYIISEPLGRNTAVAVVLSALYVREKFGNKVLWIVPSDHVIKHPDVLRSNIERAIPYAKQGYIVTFGINPTRADSNYGYIVANNTKENSDALTVERFVEKPTAEIIESMTKDKAKAFFWNSGMFVFSVDSILSEMESYGGGLLQRVVGAYSKGNRLPVGLEIMPSAYADVPSLPIDKVIMEHSKKLKVFSTQMGWMDVGSWQSLWEFTKENKNDTIQAPLSDGQGECDNCLAYLNRRFALNAY